MSMAKRIRNRLKHGYRWKGLLIINLVFLSKTFCNQPCFEGFNLHIFPFLPLIDPFTTYGFNVVRYLYKFPKMVGIQGFKLAFHSLDPVVRDGARSSYGQRIVALQKYMSFVTEF
jgi:hypothetical protein